MVAAVVVAAAPVDPRSRLLVIAPHGSYRTAPYIQAASKRGMAALLASEGRHALTGAAAHGVQITLADPEASLQAILRAAAEAPIAAVIGTDDGSTELGVQAALALGLPHNPLDSVRYARRKDLARARLAACGVPVPRHWRIDLLQPLTAQLASLDYPVVVKPVALSGSRGVIRADSPEAAVRAVERLRPILRDVTRPEEREQVLAEAFVPGAEVAVEGLLRRGQLQVLAVFDKPDALNGPFFEETYYVTPSRHPQATLTRLQQTLQRACDAYGLREGPVHAECRINDEGVWVIEVAARTIGGLCGRLLRFGTGYLLEDLVVAHALGEDLAVRSGEGAAGVMMIPIPQAGVLRRVEGMVAAQRVPFVEEVIVDVREGYELVPLPEGASYLGFIFAKAPTPEQVEAALRAAHAQLRIVVAPLWKVTEAAPANIPVHACGS